MAFADPLKEVVALLAAEPVSLYHDQDTKAQISPMLGMTRREALQLMGTEGVRQLFGADLWARRLMHVWGTLGRPPLVIPDCRFDNEAEAVKSSGGVVIRVVRPGQASEGIAEHASEAGVSDHLISFTVVNDGTPEQLQSQCLALLSLLRSEV